MSVETVKEYLKRFNAQDRVIEFNCSSATVALAAQAIGCKEREIAKSLTFKNDDRCIMIVAAGNVKVDNQKFKAQFNIKAKMLTFEQVPEYTGHMVGGVCPFALNDKTDVYLDESLKNFEFVYPACGSSNSAIKLSLSELEQFSGFKGYVDVCKE